MLVQMSRPRARVVLTERTTRLEERLRDWLTWFAANATRAQLFFHDSAIESRWQFCSLMWRGHQEIAGAILAAITDLAWTREDVHMPADLHTEIEQLILFYNMHVRTISDHDRRWEFMLRMHGKFLVILMQMNVELDKLQRETVLATVDDHKDWVVIRAEQEYGDGGE